jgi:uncharacterized protein YbdZ (MbtH family)
MHATIHQRLQSVANEQLRPAIWPMDPQLRAGWQEIFKQIITPKFTRAWATRPVNK